MADAADVAAENSVVHEESHRQQIIRLRERPVNVSGLCNRCGGTVEKSRLDANPHAMLCIDCAEEVEIENQLRKKRGPVR